VNKKISNIQRFLTLLFTDKDIGDTSEGPENDTIKELEVPRLEEKIVKIAPKDI